MDERRAQVNENVIRVYFDHIIRVLDGFTAAAILHNIIDGSRNAGILLRLDSDRVICCGLTQERARCLVRTRFSGALLIPAAEKDEECLDIREDVDQVEPRLIWVERGEGDGGL
jgi:hypothetical protein